MSLTLKDLRVATKLESGEYIGGSTPASLADLVEVLKQEGAVIDTSGEMREWENGIRVNGPPGSRFLILPLGDTP